MDRLIRGATIVYASFIVIGYFDLWTYYQFYHVPIGAYLSLTEVVTLTMPNILSYGIGLFIALMLIDAWDGTTQAQFNSERGLLYLVYRPHRAWAQLMSKAPGKKRINRLRALVSMLFFWFGFIAASVLVVNTILEPDWMFEHFIRANDDYEVFLVFGLLFLAGALNLSERFKSLQFGLFIILLAWSLFVGNTYWNFERVTNNTNKTPCILVDCAIEFGDTKIVTGDSLIYVGEVQSALFISNNRSGKTTVIPRSEIRSIVYSGPCPRP